MTIADIAPTTAKADLHAILTATWRAHAEAAGQAFHGVTDGTYRGITETIAAAVGTTPARLAEVAAGCEPRYALACTCTTAILGRFDSAAEAAEAKAKHRRTKGAHTTATTTIPREAVAVMVVAARRERALYAIERVADAEAEIRGLAATIADGLTRLAEDVGRLAISGLRSAVEVAGDVQHAVAWGVANLSADRLTARVADLGAARLAAHGLVADLAAQGVRLPDGVTADGLVPVEAAR